MGAIAAQELEVMLGRPSYAQLTEEAMRPLWHGRWWWWLLLVISGLGTVMLILAILQTLGVGIGVFGDNIPVAWAFPIVDYVWWAGIGVGGILLSTLLRVMGLQWRSSLNRLLEMLALFALTVSGLFPILHMGRPWFAYWLTPYPSVLGTWPQFKSALTWDVTGLVTLLTLAFIFSYLGMLPDLAALRDRSDGLLRRRIYGIFALGWRGSAREWGQFESAYGLLAALGLAVSVAGHSIIALDFATATLPGWHSTIFPPYFVVNAVFSGLAMLLVLAIPLRRAYGWENVITEHHLDNLAKMTLTVSWMLLYCYVAVKFTAWYTASPSVRSTSLVYQPLGAFAWIFWTMIGINVVLPQVFWSRRMRRNKVVLFTVGVLILFSTWIESFENVPTALAHGYLPSSWHHYFPSRVDWAMLWGTISLFVLLCVLALRYVPVLSMHGVKRLRREVAGEDGGGTAGGPGSTGEVEASHG